MSQSEHSELICITNNGSARSCQHMARDVAEAEPQADADNMDFSVTNRTVTFTENAFMKNIMNLQKEKKGTLQRAYSLRETILSFSAKGYVKEEQVTFEKVNVLCEEMLEKILSKEEVENYEMWFKLKMLTVHVFISDERLLGNEMDPNTESDVHKWG